MKNILTLSVIILLSIASQAQAADSATSYILKKQYEAAQTKRESLNLVNKLRSLPQDTVYMVNTTPKLASDEHSVQPPSPEELEAIATAAGGSNNLAASQK